MRQDSRALGSGHWSEQKISVSCRSGQRPVPRAQLPSAGFTLIELIIAISLSGIVVAFAAMFIVAPVKAYQAQSRRAEMVDSADAVLRLMGRDIRAALPNSVRVVDNGTTVALELLATVDAVRYRDGGTATAAQELNFGGLDDAFRTMSPFDGISRPTFDSRAHYLAIYNVGVPGADAYSMSNVITPADTRIQISASATAGEDNVTMTPPFRFVYGSPGHRVYLLSGPVTYLCNKTARTIRRYTGYSITANQTNRDSADDLNNAGASSSAVANNIFDCTFDYLAGSALRSGLVTLRITINKEGESIWLVHQVHVENAP